MVHFSLVPCEKLKVVVHTDIQEVLYSGEQIAQRVAQIGDALTREHKEHCENGESIVVVGILRGAAIFMADLVRKIELPLEMDYMAVSSYGTAATSSGEVKVLHDLSTSITGKHVIIVEDVVDTGLTLQRLIGILMEREPASLEVVVLLKKEMPDQASIQCAHIGFDCPNEFIVGYGLDYAEHYRNLPYIGILKQEIYQ